MSLLAEIEGLRSSVLISLQESHDYYTYTKRVWRAVQRDVRDGRTFAFRNRATGSTLDEQDLVRRAQGYVTRQLPWSALQQLTSLCEDFIFSFLRLWLLAHPGSLTKKQVELGDVLAAENKSEIILTVVDKWLNELRYRSVDVWFKKIQDLTKLTRPEEEIGMLAEMKASRDVVIHNSGIVNATYVKKAGRHARRREGQEIEVSEQYYRQCWAMVRGLVEGLSRDATAKVDGRTERRVSAPD